MPRRLVLSGVVAALTAFALGGAVLAAGGGGGFGSPGTTKFQDVSASAELSDGNGTFLFLYVDRGMQTFKLRGVSGAPVMYGPETVLNYFGESPVGGFTYFSGCFVIPDSAFSVASNLSTATLAVDPSIETPCPGFLIPADAGGRPGLSGPAPDAGGGGGGGGEGITANLTWTSNGAVTSFDVTTNATCQGAVAHSVGSALNTFASVSGTISLLSDVETAYAAVNSYSTTEVITSAFSDACTGA
ncbi:MAG TPA: hypothetical protein VKT20_12465 [Candidatus Dormibacteraeota bacterium]|nr:hypothetical protein [Candidatus Dormibacteraeota bacterium]